MQLAGAIRKQVVLRPKRTANGCARARCPDVKQLPKALWAPLQRLVRSRPPTPLLNDGRRRPLFDWDAWVRQHLTREYWDSKGTIRTSWPECVRAWAAMRVHDDFSLVATSDALVRSIVTVAVAETLAHQHGTPFDRLDLSVRRHINTAASRQRDDACAKVTMFHVVQLAFARFDYDLFMHRLCWESDRAAVLQDQIHAAFGVLHEAASRSAQPTALREIVITLTSVLQAPIRGFLFLPWYEPSRLPLPSGRLLKYAARAFLTSLPAPDATFLFETPLSAHCSHLTAWLEQLRSPMYNKRWNALIKFFKTYYARAPNTEIKDPRAEISFVIMVMLLYMASGWNRSLIPKISAVSTVHARGTPCEQRSLIFRDLLDQNLDNAERPQYLRRSHHAPIRKLQSEWHPKLSRLLLEMEPS